MAKGRRAKIGGGIGLDPKTGRFDDSKWPMRLSHKFPHFEMEPTKRATTYRRAGDLAILYFYGTSSSLMEVPDMTYPPNALGAELIGLAKERRAGSRFVDPTWIERRAAIINRPDAKGILDVEELEGLVIGWAAAGAEVFRRSVMHEVGADQEKVRFAEMFWLEHLFGPATVFPRGETKRVTDAYLQEMDKYRELVSEQATPLEFILMARYAAIKQLAAAEDMYQWFAEHLGMPTTKKHSAFFEARSGDLTEWQKRCIRYWQANVLQVEGESLRQLDEALWPDHAHETWYGDDQAKQVRDFLRELRKEIREADGDAKRVPTTVRTALHDELIPVLLYDQRPGE